MTAKPIPDGYHTVTPYICAKDAAEAIEFYKRAFAAVEHLRLVHNGRIGHAEIQIGNSMIMIVDESPESGALSPRTLGGSPVSLHLYVEDADAMFAQAIAAGGKVKRPIADQFYGDRMGGIEDPFGHTWWIATRKEDLSVEEIERRAAQAGH